MKTKTRSNLLKIIKKNGKARPAELASALQISAQAVHRHLKVLVAEGSLEPLGSPPFTEYAMADSPDFSEAFQWFQGKKMDSPSTHLCETRDTFMARLSRFTALRKQGFPECDLPLLISAIGEIGNNSFDHNLGHWEDAVGCWFEILTTRSRVWVLIADRGQGIFSSLSRVIKDLPNDELALKSAFEARVSGRAPENRGNGLKFVRNVVNSASQRGIACRSGSGVVHYGDYGPDCSKVLESVSRKSTGTITLVAWRSK